MNRWQVTTVDGSVEVGGGSWLSALSEAVAALKLESGVLAQMVCEVDSGQSVVVRNPKTGYAFLIERLPAAPAAPDTPPPDDPTEEMDVESFWRLPPAFPPAAPAPPRPRRAPSVPEPPAPPPREVPVPREPVGVVALGVEVTEASVPPRSIDDATLPPVDDLPAFSMPAPSIAPPVRPITEHERVRLSLPPRVHQPPEDLDETLFMAAAVIGDGETLEDAAERSLAAIEAVVPVGAASVLYAGRADAALHFVAAHGPHAERTLRIAVPFDHGIAGFCHRSGAGVIIQDARTDERIDRTVEQATGYQTASILAVALRDSASNVHGCLELLNSPTGFLTWHLDAARVIATALADWIAARPGLQATARPEP